MAKEFFHIIRMRVENILRLKAVEIKPEGNAVVIEGKNAQGKSSVMSAIAMAIGGKELCPDEPIHRGEETAEVMLDLGKYIITRKWTANDRSTIKVTMAGKDGEPGAVVGSPQTFLDSLIGDLTFDPLKFVNSDRKARAEILRKVSGLDTAAEDGAKAKAYSARTEINRELDRRKKEFDSIGPVDEPSEKLRALDDINSDIEKATKRNTEITNAKKEVRYCNEQIALLEARKEKAAKLALAETEDVEKLRAEQERAQSMGKIRYKLDRKETLSKEIKKLQKDSDARTAEIKGAEDSKVAKIAEAKIPIKGLEVTDDGTDILFNKIPFDQASASEKMRVAMAIGAAQNPKIRIIFINDGSLLDKESLEEVKKFAEAKDLQCWIEKVADKPSGQKGTIYIEDGEEKNA